MNNPETNNTEILPNQIGDFTEITGLTKIGTLMKEIDKNAYTYVDGNILDLPAQESIKGKYFLAIDNKGKKFFVKRTAYYKHFSFENREYKEPSQNQIAEDSNRIMITMMGNIYTEKLRRIFDVKIPECKVMRINGELFEIHEYIDGWDTNMGADLEIPADSQKQIRFSRDLALMGIFQFLEGNIGDNNQIMQTKNGDVYLVDTSVNIHLSDLESEHNGLFYEPVPGDYLYLLSKKELKEIQIKGLNELFTDVKFLELLKSITKEKLIEILGTGLLKEDHFNKLINQIHSRITYLIEYITDYKKTLSN